LQTPIIESDVPLTKSYVTLYLNKFRWQPANSRFDSLFTPLNNSSGAFAATIGSIFHLWLKRFQSDHLKIISFRVLNKWNRLNDTYVLRILITIHLLKLVLPFFNRYKIVSKKKRFFCNNLFFHDLFHYRYNDSFHLSLTVLVHYRRF